MPIYEYKCDECGDVLEHMQKFTDEPLKDCPKCGGQLNKLISSTSFVLKGDGWYVTDYPSKDRQDSMSSEKPAGSSETADKKPIEINETKSDSSKSDSTTATTAGASAKEPVGV
ncbi:FmdB family zinc ribbon protein [Candidatus Magnetominusculus xianensis]|uniref:FmdB family transcriptional regulator n=1 Tax=Candidatus Magnetominusculus xianensis TaxID=1748249 RepID=A0ABR5SGB4_9BACT|nr:FmdB family zinc ribbon protein [Candidatus Magnetominusculus xianensis]KWT88547.1 FmdB family transcriptional regulator [Candidatus Magnetominusculus xianensis]MBF0404091.1 hypothetical protein [Nitrospirota bacterium]